MNERPEVHRARRRLRPGPRLAVGGRGSSARGRASGSPTSAPRRAARRPRLAGAGRDGRGRRRPPSPGRAWSSTTPPRRPGAAERLARRRRRRPSPAAAPGLVRSGPGRRPLLGPRLPAPPGRRPLARSMPTPSTGSPSCRSTCSTQPRDARPPGGLARLQRLHPDRGRDDSSVAEAFAGATPTSGAARPPAAPWRPFGTRRAAPAPGGRHRRHGRCSPGVGRADGRPTRAGPAAATPVRRRPWPAPTGRTARRPGPRRLRRCRRRHPRGPRWSGPRRGPRGRAGFDGRPARWSSPTASRPSRNGAARAGRGLRRPGRDHRRHRLRPPRPHAGGHPGAPSSARRRAWPRRCAWSTRSGGCRGASPAPSAGRWCSTLPGSPKGAVECLEAVLDVVPHALALLGGERPH